jgi:hypothetical protein
MALAFIYYFLVMEYLFVLKDDLLNYYFLEFCPIAQTYKHKMFIQTKAPAPSKFWECELPPKLYKVKILKI